MQAAMMIDVKSNQVEVLRTRVLDGHSKLWKRWDYVRTIHASDPELSRHLEIWDSACDKLKVLCDDLMALGFYECLYSRDLMPESFCLVCPSRPWSKDDCLCWELQP